MAYITEKPLFVLVDPATRRCYSIQHPPALQPMVPSAAPAVSQQVLPPLDGLQVVYVRSDFSRTVVLAPLWQLFERGPASRRCVVEALLTVSVYPSSALASHRTFVQAALASAAFGLGIAVERDPAVARALSFPIDARKRLYAFTAAAVVAALGRDTEVLDYCIRIGVDPFTLMVVGNVTCLADVLVAQVDTERLMTLVAQASDQVDALYLWQMLSEPKLKREHALLACVRARLEALQGSRY